MLAVGLRRTYDQDNIRSLPQIPRMSRQLPQESAWSSPLPSSGCGSPPPSLFLVGASHSAGIAHTVSVAEGVNVSWRWGALLSGLTAAYTAGLTSYAFPSPQPNVPGSQSTLACAYLQLLNMLQQTPPLVGFSSHEVVVALMLLHKQVFHIQAYFFAGTFLLQLLKDAFQIQKEVVVTLHYPATCSHPISCERLSS